jgi:hypothetical protein
MISADRRVEVLARPSLREKLEAAGLLRDVGLDALEGVESTGYHGRGRPRRLRLPGERPIVLKELRHGGLLGGLLRDRFLGAGRLHRTLELLERLGRRGIPAAEPALARVRRSRWLPMLCRLELGTVEHEGSLDLDAWLRGDPAPASRREIAVRLGTWLRTLHGLGVRHADLNVKNLLVLDPQTDAPDLCFLDFEGSRVEPGGLSRPAALGNLERLYRSFRKRELWPGRVTRTFAVRVLVHYSARNWKGWWRQVQRRSRRREPLHRISWRLFGRR